MKLFRPFMFLLLVCAVAGVAQTTSQISGTVSVANGSVVPGAQVTLTNTGTNAVRTAQTQANGTYRFPALDVGQYKIAVAKTGFKTFAQSGIVLQVNSSPVVNVTLQVGAMTQTVEVQANASMIEAQGSAVGQVIQPEQVVDLPLNGRQATQLIALSGAAVLTGGGGLTENLDFPTAVAYSVAGSVPNSTNYTLDGAPNIDYRTDVGEPLPMPDALQEFKVTSSAQAASTDSRPGGTVNAVTKSGTNQFHGDLFEFLRNGVMDAKGYTFPNSAGIVPPGVRDNLKRNQFGGTLGGPILHNKLFFFYGYQGTTERQQGTPSNTTVPTAAMLAGDFTAYMAPPCQRKQAYLKDDLNGHPLVTAHDSNVLQPQWLNTPSAKIAAKIAAMLPTPTDACGDVARSQYQSDNYNEQTARVDWQHTANDTIFARYFITNYNLLSYLAPGQLNLLSSSGDGLADRYQSLVAGDTHIVSPTLVSSLRANATRSADDRTSNSRIPTICSLGAMATCEQANQLDAFVNIPGNLGYDYENQFGVSESLVWQTGAHDLQFGGFWQHVQMNSNGTYQVDPEPSFTSGNTSYTGNNLADFITGNVDGLRQGGGQLGREGQNFATLFLQDNWKVSRELNLDYGVRWAPYFPQHNKYGMASDFSLANYLAGVHSQMFHNAPPGVTFPGDAGFNGMSDTPTDLKVFDPTVGIAWDPSGNGNEVIRAGYGLSYDTSTLWNAMHVVLNPPWGATLSITPQPVDPTATSAADTGGLANMYYGVVGGDPFPTGTAGPNSVFLPGGNYVFEAANAKPSYTQQWNVSVQKQFLSNWLASATYIGSRSRHIWTGVNLDPSTLIHAGMTAPGIVDTSAMTGITGPCTLRYGATTATFATCNGGPTATDTTGTINNQSARGALSLANPAEGPAMSGGVVEDEAIGVAAYDGLLLRLNHRLSNGLSIQSNYTWSHCLDTANAGQDIASDSQNPNDPTGDYGNCATDRRQLFNLSVIAQSRQVGSGWTNALLGHWAISGIFTATSGSPVTVTDGSNISLTGIGNPVAGRGYNDRPNLVGDPYGPGPVAANPSCKAPSAVGTETNWFNQCAFMDQAAGTFGNLGRNSLFGPGSWNLDSALWRTFPVSEGKSVEFRIEGFNILNHPQIGNPTSSLSSSTFDEISSSAHDSRIMQVALKFIF
ncbi:MAG TPA: carboxypeptidase-like regulatory domain-containing protein [Terriglobales bacterium]|jgi:hypothetical protein